MKRCVLIAMVSVLCAASGALADDPNAPKVLDKEGINELAEKLVKDGQALYAGERPEMKPAERLANVTYGKEAMDVLPAVLTSRRPLDVATWTLNQLLQPLLKADKEDIRRHMRVIQSIHRRFSRYSPPLTYHKSQLKQLAFPDDIDRLPPERSLLVIERVQKLRQKKMFRDLQHKFKNDASADLEKTVFKLMMKAQDVDVDRDLIRLLQSYERQNKWTFVDLLDVLKHHASECVKSRAEYFFRELKNLAESKKYHQTKLVKLGEMKVMPAENSHFPTQHIYVGVTLFEAANKFAEQAGKDKLKYPDEKEVKEYRKKHKR
ncbi:MAG: hypothetical protein ACLFV7_10315 [Phycisphaerae bacterium]